MLSPCPAAHPTTFPPPCPNPTSVLSTPAPAASTSARTPPSPISTLPPPHPGENCQRHQVNLLCHRSNQQQAHTSSRPSRSSDSPADRTARSSVLKNPSPAHVVVNKPQTARWPLRGLEQGSNYVINRLNSCILSTMRTARSRDSTSRTLWASFHPDQLSRC
jgi:hypothetical protein